MKGYIDEQGRDMPPCGTCKHKNKMTVESPCYNCVDAVDWRYINQIRKVISFITRPTAQPRKAVRSNGGI